MIRRMKPDDLEQVVKVLRELHAKSKYARFRPHWPTVVSTLTAAATRQTGLVLVAVHKEKITGVLIGVVQEYWWAEPKIGPRVASDLIFYSKVRGDGEEMMRQFIEWAWNTPRVVRVECGVSSGVQHDDIPALYRAAGFGFHGPMFDMDHPKLRE